MREAYWLNHPFRIRSSFADITNSPSSYFGLVGIDLALNMDAAVITHLSRVGEEIKILSQSFVRSKEEMDEVSNAIQSFSEVGSA